MLVLRRPYVAAAVLREVLTVQAAVRPKAAEAPILLPVAVLHPPLLHLQSEVQVLLIQEVAVEEVLQGEVQEVQEVRAAQADDANLLDLTETEFYRNLKIIIKN